MSYTNGINNTYNVGIYIRLSREDEDKLSESESIINQKSLLLQYAKENNLRVYDIYIDDGYSGTNFDRPGFNRLLEDIEKKKVNMVITKDMSRLGRDYIGTGNLIERYFPEHNVRYIAVTDNIDTFLDNSNNDIAPFKAIMNDMYAKDISKKIKASLKAKQKEGKFVGGRTPFGYDIDSENKNHLVINEEQAKVVQRIYKMALEGMTYFKIAKQLTEECVKTPAQYYSFEWKNNYNLKYGQWHPKTIQDILNNRIYTGDMVQNKRSKVNYKVKKVIKNNPSQYIIVENTHEPIIDKETFEEIQKRLPKNVGRCEKKENHLLDGLLYCGDCGHRISVQPRRKTDNNCYTICNYYRTYIKDRPCSVHCNNYDKLEKVILDNLKESCEKYLDSKKISQNVIDNTSKDEKENTIKEINSLNNELKQLNDNLDSIYLDKINKTISEEQFERLRQKIDNEINFKSKKIEELNSRLNNSLDLDTKKRIIENEIKEYLSMENPSRELIVNLIEKIEIFSDKRINIILTFSN